MTSNSVKPGTTNSTAMAAAALAAAMAQGGPFGLRRPSNIFRAETVIATPAPIVHPSSRVFTRRQSEISNNVRRQQQQQPPLRRSSLLFSHELEAASASLILPENKGGRQRLSSIISNDDEEGELDTMQ